MKKIIVSILIMLLLIFISIEILIHSTPIIESINFSFNIWKNNIFPSLFPFFVLSEILINYGFIEFIGEIAKKPMNKIFKVSGESAFVFIMSMISGFPSNSKYIRELLEKNIINEKEASKLLTFTHFSSPLFILGTISISFLNNKEIGILILISHYIGNIIIGLLFRNYYTTKASNKTSIKIAIMNMHKKRIENKKTLGEIISSSLINTINTLLQILGVITLFLIITTIIDVNINISPYYQAILNGFIEMTQGLKYVSLLNIPLKVKGTLSVAFISFGGLSVHLQIISILSGTSIKYIPFLLARILHAIISSLIFFILFDYWIYFFL